MKTPPPAKAPLASQELLDTLLDFTRRKFYQEASVQFAKDRPRLLKWVLLYPAAWLNKRGVTLPADRYRAIVETVLMDSLRFGQQTKVTYFPAYLRQVIQSHFQHHGDDIYQEAKSLRNLTEHALLIAGRSTGSAPDPVRDLANAARLLKPTRRPSKPARTSSQPSLFDL